MAPQRPQPPSIFAPAAAAAGPPQDNTAQTAVSADPIARGVLEGHFSPVREGTFSFEAEPLQGSYELKIKIFGKEYPIFFAYKGKDVLSGPHLQDLVKKIGEMIEKTLQQQQLEHIVDINMINLSKGKIWVQNKKTGMFQEIELIKEKGFMESIKESLQVFSSDIKPHDKENARRLAIEVQKLAKILENPPANQVFSTPPPASSSIANTTAAPVPISQLTSSLPPPPSSPPTTPSSGHAASPPLSSPGSSHSQGRASPPASPALDPVIQGSGPSAGAAASVVSTAVNIQRDALSDCRQTLSGDEINAFIETKIRNYETIHNVEAKFDGHVCSLPQIADTSEESVANFIHRAFYDDNGPQLNQYFLTIHDDVHHHYYSLFIDKAQKTIEYFDSKGIPISDQSRPELFQYLPDFYEKIFERTFEWRYVITIHPELTAQSGPIQIEKDSISCGVFSLWYFFERIDHPQMNIYQVIYKKIQECKKEGRNDDFWDDVNDPYSKFIRSQREHLIFLFNSSSQLFTALLGNPPPVQYIIREMKEHHLSRNAVIREYVAANNALAEASLLFEAREQEDGAGPSGEGSLPASAAALGAEGVTLVQDGSQDDDSDSDGGEADTRLFAGAEAETRPLSI